MDELGEYQQRYRDALIKRAGIKPKSDDIPTITRAEAESRGMQRIDIPTITRAEATRIGLKPLGSNTQDEVPHIWKHDMKPKQPDHTIIDRVKEVGQGVASGLGSIPDGVNKIVAAPVTHLTGYAADGISKVASATGFDNVADSVDNFAQGAHELGDKYSNSNIAGDLSSAEILDTGKEPDNLSSTFKAVGDVGSAVVPFTAGSKVLNATNQIYNSASVVAKNGGKLAAPWLNNLNKFLGGTKLKDVGTFAVMGAGGELAKSDNPETSEMENTAREFAGGIFAGATIPSALQGVARKVANVFNQKEIAKRFTRAEKAFIKEYSGKLETGIIKSSEKLDLPLAVDIISTNPKAQGLIKNRLASSFVDDSFIEVEKGFSSKIIESWEKNVYDKIGSKIEGDASETTNSYIKNLFNSNRQQSTQLYNDAKSLLKNEVIYPVQSTNSAKELVKELSYGSKAADSSGKSLVINRLEEFVASSKDGLEIRDLLGWKRDLADLGREQLNRKSLLKGIASEIDIEISSMVKSGTIKENKPFVDAWKTATDYNKKNVQELKKIKIVKDLIQDKFPKDIMALMKTKQGMVEMSTLLKGNKELWQSLKRVRLSETLSQKNIIDAKGNVSANNFINFLVKEKDYAMSLMGKEQFVLMEKYFLPYMKKLEKIGRVINFSNTARGTRDPALIENATGVFSKNTLGNMAAGAAAGAVGGKAFGLSVPAAAGGATYGGVKSSLTSRKAKSEIRAIKELSRIASDEKVLKGMIKHMETFIPLEDRILKGIKSVNKEKVINTATKGLTDPVVQRQLLLLNKSDDFEKASKKSIRDFSSSKAVQTIGAILPDTLNRKEYYSN